MAQFTITMAHNATGITWSEIGMEAFLHKCIAKIGTFKAPGDGKSIDSKYDWPSIEEIQWPLGTTDLSMLRAAISRFQKLKDRSKLKLIYKILLELGVSSSTASQLVMLGPVWVDLFFSEASDIPTPPEIIQKELKAALESN